MSVANRHAPNPPYGLSVPTWALILGVVSGLSLPLGAYLGVVFYPVKETICAAMMAFGAGALMFAVTVELYGHALAEVHHGNMGIIELAATIGGAVVGSLFYLYINRWLEHTLMPKDTQTEVAPLLGSARLPSQTPSLALASEPSYNEDPGPNAAVALRSATTEQPQPPRRRASSPERGEAEAKATWRNDAKKRWKKLASFTRSINLLRRAKDNYKHARGRGKGLLAWLDHQFTSDVEQAEDQEANKARLVAFGLFLGLLIDGVPEGLLMGFLAAEGHLTPTLIVSLFIANFPEAFSSASLLKQAKMSAVKIVGMWTSLCLIVGGLCGLSCYLLLAAFPNYSENPGSLPTSWLVMISLIEGVTGGAMLACISSVMLPESFEMSGKDGPVPMSSGFLCVCGFLVSVTLKVASG